MERTSTNGNETLSYDVVVNPAFDLYTLPYEHQLLRKTVRDVADDKIWLNTCAAEAMGARVGDKVTIGYDVWDDSGVMASRDATFIVGGIRPMNGPGSDSTLTPESPLAVNSVP